MRLIYKLTLVTVLPALLIWGVGYYATQQAEHSLRAAIVETSRSRARSAMDEIDRALHLRVAAWQAYVQSELVRETLRASNAQLQAMDDPQAWINDREAAWPPPGRSSQHLDRLLEHSLSRDLRLHIETLEADAGYPVVSEVFITNRFGANVAQTGRTEDFRQDDENWWRDAARDRLFVGDVEYDKSADAFSVDICVRIGWTTASSWAC